MSGEYIPVEELIVYSSGDTIINIGETLQYTATVLPQNATDPSIVWRSDDPSIATVDQNGLITGISEGWALIWISTSNSSVFTFRAIKVEESRDHDIELPFVLGDINNDYCVTEEDVLLFMQYFAGYPVTIHSETADVNRDGHITRADAMYLARALDNWTDYDLEYDHEPDDDKDDPYGDTEGKLRR